MVFKVSKGGVRSGNTLRGLRCMRVRRYSRQACIIGRSSLPLKEVRNILESSVEDDFISSTLGSTDVMLSLNKKERWQLPGAVSHLIKTGSFNERTSVVSLLERHKLKRRANCFSFVCNQGKIRHVTPRQKRYFCFNLENIVTGRSNRDRKRRRAKVMRAVNIPQIKIRGGRNSSRMKTIEVYTLLGSSNVDNVDEAKSENDSSKPGYHLEVFYPCPSSCSLVYNPKYTDVRLESDEDGKMHIKSNINSSRAKRKHRKRFTTKDLEIFAEDMIGDYTDESYEDELEDVSDNDVHDISDTDSVDSDEPNEGSCLASKHQVSLFDNIFGPNEGHTLEYLITQAEKSKVLCESGKHRRRKHSSSLCSQGRPRMSYFEEKSHIVYEEDNSVVNNSRVTPSISNPLVFTSEANLHPARVILPSAETDPDKLRAMFGYLYAEAECEPRRFAINMTENIQSLLSTSGSTKGNTLYTSFLVFVHDGVYADGLDRFNVTFNSNVCKESLTISKMISFEHRSVEEVMNQVTSTLLDLQNEKLVAKAYPLSREQMPEHVLNVVYNFLGVKVEAFHAHDEMARALWNNALQEKVACSKNLSRTELHFDLDILCGICYENINQAQAGAASSTQLSTCGHMFCDECWRAHLRANLRNGATKVVCPGYDCDKMVGPVTLLSLLHVSEVSQMFQRRCEEKAESSRNCKWCPNPVCGRVIKLDSQKSINDTSLDVVCVCGHVFCFSCQSQPHWPASCEQTEVYIEKLHTLELPKETVEELLPASAFVQPSLTKAKKIKTLEVEGRLCPRCLRFIEKNGGCLHISCNCGNQFCWKCLKPWLNHTECKPNAFFVYEYTRRVRIKHRMLPGSNTEFTQVMSPVNSVKLPKSHQKITMYQKALQQRMEAKEKGNNKHIREMTKRIAHAAQRDLHFKQELLSQLEVQTDPTDVASLMFAPVASHVTEFLRSCQKTRRELHRVAEFTFVLIQDAQDSVDRRRVLNLATDLSGYCSFIKSTLESCHNQDPRNAVQRLKDIQMWARRALVFHVSSVNKLRSVHFV